MGLVDYAINLFEREPGSQPRPEFHDPADPIEGRRSSMLDAVIYGTEKLAEVYDLDNYTPEQTAITIETEPVNAPVDMQVYRAAKAAEQLDEQAAIQDEQAVRIANAHNAVKEAQSFPHNNPLITQNHDLTEAA